MNVKLYKIDQIYYADYMLLSEKWYQNINYGTLNMDISVHYKFVVSLKKDGYHFKKFFFQNVQLIGRCLYGQTPDVRLNVKKYIG